MIAWNSGLETETSDPWTLCRYGVPSSRERDVCSGEHKRFPIQSDGRWLTSDQLDRWTRHQLIDCTRLSVTSRH